MTAEKEDEMTIKITNNYSAEIAAALGDGYRDHIKELILNVVRVNRNSKRLAQQLAEREIAAVVKAPTLEQTSAWLADNVHARHFSARNYYSCRRCGCCIAESNYVPTDEWLVMVALRHFNKCTATPASVVRPSPVVPPVDPLDVEYDEVALRDLVTRARARAGAVDGLIVPGDIPGWPDGRTVAQELEDGRLAFTPAQRAAVSAHWSAELRRRAPAAGRQPERGVLADLQDEP